MALRRVLLFSSSKQTRALVSIVTRHPLRLRFYSSKTIKDEDDVVTLNPNHGTSTFVATGIGLDDEEDDDEEDDDVALGPSGVEYGGPMRGGKLKEPTRFGDWERNGRCSDF
uniref:Succinate dehydrogenase assembly factor 4, mitochondrial n=1 Tax=Peronospora matthiolae TaxID=2874970 RepID=A0AAV1T069_9STRA